MPTSFKFLPLVAAVAAMPSAAMAQYVCAPGYTYVNGVCQPMQPQGYYNQGPSNPRYYNQGSYNQGSSNPGYYNQGSNPGYSNQGYSNPASGAMSGESAGAASGYATGGPVGAVVGGALGTATGAVSGTANMVTGAPPARTCAYGYTYYNGACYPAR